MDKLINFHGVSHGYEDTGEGGMYVMLVVTDSCTPPDECCVDVHITLTAPDVLVGGIHKDELWVPTDNSMVHPRNWYDATSVPVRSATHLGSTSLSLWHPGRQEYWSAAYADLTNHGAAVYNAMAAVYGPHNVHLLTFLPAF